ncbi:hypothetical protein Fot_03701 [Forsythia ovata]|uniref:Uncharacterized protein n=1 Tax=Forsythia ovata TaxID=205694 RepID=A0ABD1XAZ1_9LAMI
MIRQKAKQMIRQELEVMTQQRDNSSSTTAHSVSTHPDQRHEHLKKLAIVVLEMVFHAALTHFMENGDCDLRMVVGRLVNGEVGEGGDSNSLICTEFLFVQTNFESLSIFE